MRYIYSLLFLLVSIVSYSQGPPVSSGNIDLDYTKESIPSSPEVGNLGRYGNFDGDPYTGKVGISIPLHTINFEGLEIPITLSYDSGGLRVTQESSWVGMNWSLSANAAVTRNIQGNDDLNENFIPTEIGDISSRVFNDIDVIVPTNGTEPYVPLDDIQIIHETYTPNGVNKSRFFADTQPDIYEVTVFGKSYKFRLKRRQSSSDNVLDTHIFDNMFARITYNLSNQSFTLIDDRGFTFLFSTKDYSATFSSSNSSHQNASNYTKEFTLAPMLDDSNQGNNTVISSWLLNTIVSPTGKEINFSYDEGAHFTFPVFTAGVYFKEGGTSNTLYNNRTDSNRTFTSSMSIIHSNYLSSITGDFGEVIFNSSSDRKDLATGFDMVQVYPSAFGGFDFVFHTRTPGNTTNNRIDFGHGTTTTNFYNLQARRLNNILITDYNDNDIKTILFNNDNYFNEDNYLNAGDRARYLRLKLNDLTIQDRKYSFEYNQPNSLPDKETFDRDFWGFYNGAGNTVTDIPSIGRFGTTYSSEPPLAPVNPRQTLAQVFFNLEAADRGANFQYGNIGNLNKVIYPTGGYTEFEYEGNTALVNAPAPYVVTDRFANNKLRWTNLIDEDKYNFTYLYLKYSKSPNYSFYNKEYVPDPNGNTNPIYIDGSDIDIEYPSIVTGEGLLKMYTSNDNQQSVVDIPKYYVQDMINLDRAYPLFYYGDWINNTNVYDDDPPLGYNSVFIPPGSFRLMREGNIYNAPAVRLVPENFSILESSVAEAVELFEIGGSRIKTITNRNNDGSFINKKRYVYSLSDGFDDGTSSSGKLMDDLIYHTKFSGFHSYTPTNGTYANSDGLRITSNSSLGTKQSARGSHIGYSFVSEQNVDANDTKINSINRTYSNESNDYFKETFEVYWDYNELSQPQFIEKVPAKNVPILGMEPKTTYEYSNGNILSESFYDCSDNLVRSSTNDYTNININTDSNHYANFQGISFSRDESGDPAPWFLENDTYITYQLPISYSRASVPTYTQTIDYLDDGSQYYSEQYYDYDEHQNLVKSESIVDDGESSITKYFYPYNSEVYNQSGMSHLRSDGFYNQVVRSETYLNDVILSTSKVSFNKNTSTGNVTRAIYSEGAKGLSSFERNQEFEKYDTDGRLLQTRSSDGRPVSYVWGYNNQSVIAKIDNATYDQIAPYVANLKTRSNNDNDTCLFGGNCNEQLLRDALISLSNSLILDEAYITYYTYNPSIGVTSITDTRGATQYFVYDSFNRIEYVVDRDGNVLSRNEYNITDDLTTIMGADALGVEGCSTETTDEDPQDDPDGQGDIPIEIDPDRTQISNSKMSRNGSDFKLLKNYAIFLASEGNGSLKELAFQSAPYGGSGNFEYRWKVRGGSFNDYSSSPIWSLEYNCSLGTDDRIEVICEVRDITLSTTSRVRIKHLVDCN